MKPIHKILDVEPRYYEERILFHNYFLWCEMNSYDDFHFQNILANAPIYSWWLQEYRKLENEFRQDVDSYIGYADQRATTQLYINTCIKIRNFYPKSLLQTARKTHIVCSLN